MARTKPTTKPLPPTPEKLRAKMEALRRARTRVEEDDDEREQKTVNGKSSSGSKAEKQAQSSKSERRDRWSSIEDGDDQLSAVAVYGMNGSSPASTTIMPLNSSSKRKQKRKRSSDGLNVPLFEVHAKKQKEEQRSAERKQSASTQKAATPTHIEKSKTKHKQSETSQKKKLIPDAVSTPMPRATVRKQQNEQATTSNNKKKTFKPQSNSASGDRVSSSPSPASLNRDAENPSVLANLAVFSKNTTPLSRTSPSKHKTHKKEKVSPKKKGRDSVIVTEAERAEMQSEYIVEEPDDSIVSFTNGHSRKLNLSNSVMVLSNDEEGEESVDLDDSSFLLPTRKNKRNRNQVLSSSEESESDTDENEEVESDIEEEDEEEGSEMDELRDAFEEAAEKTFRTGKRSIRQFLDDEAEEVFVPVDGGSELDSNDSFIVEDDDVIDEEEEMESDEGEDVDTRTAIEEEAESSGNETEMGEDRPIEKAEGRLSVNFKPPDLDSFPFNSEDSSVSANKAFAWIIAPYDTQHFFEKVYQKTVLHVKRNNSRHYGNLFTAQSLTNILEKHNIEYTTHLNVAEYKDGQRKTLNGTGRAYASIVRDYIQSGCSIQLVCPQAFDDRIWYVCELLQELFGCFVGANTYLTPAASAGFAPHWDDIDAFILQTEGRKHWTVYAPRNANEELPLESSGNLSVQEMASHRPVWEGWLEQGELLYVPRGFIHKARTDANTHSLHVTLSTGMHHSFADLLKKLMEDTVDALSESRMSLRRGLPVGILDMGGVAEVPYSLEEQKQDKLGAALHRHLTSLRNLVTESLLDSSIDVIAREFFRTALPPRLTPEERSLSAVGRDTQLLGKKTFNWTANCKVRLLRRHTQRLLLESDEKAFLVHRVSNSRFYEGRSEATVDFDVKYIPVFEQLNSAYPDQLQIHELSTTCSQLKLPQVIACCNFLYQHGLLLVKFT